METWNGSNRLGVNDPSLSSGNLQLFQNSAELDIMIFASAIFSYWIKHEAKS